MITIVTNLTEMDEEKVNYLVDHEVDVCTSLDGPKELHDYNFLGDNFRERERIKNRTKRWLSRLRKMSVLERQALLSAIYSAYDK